MNYILVFTAVSLICLFKILNNYFANVYNYWTKRRVNGPVPLPVFGNFLINLLKPSNEVEVQRLLRYGRVYGTFEFSKPILTIADPALIREVAIKHFHNFQNRYYRMPADEFLAKTMFFSTDDTWKSLRSYLTPLFTSKKVKTMFRCVNECAENTLEYIHSIGDRELTLKDVMLSFTMDVICKCVFGMNTNAFKDPNNEFLVRSQQMMNISFWRIFMSFLIPKRIHKLHKSLDFSFFDPKMLSYFTDVLSSIITQRKISKIENNDFVNLMLSLEEMEDEYDTDTSETYMNETKEMSDGVKNKERVEKKMLNNKEILAQAFMFFIAGNETTSTFFNFTIYSLAINPEIQERLHDEIVKCLNDTDELNFDIINSMPYLDAVVNESLRMYPPVVVLDRFAAEDIVLGDGSIKIDKGTVVNLPFYAIQHDPQFFPEPHTFKPERFLPENKHLIKPYTFIPFGVGPRYCIGMRFALMIAKIFLIKLLKQYKVLKTKNTAMKPNYTKIFGALASEPLIVAFTKRQL